MVTGFDASEHGLHCYITVWLATWLLPLLAGCTVRFAGQTLHGSTCWCSTCCLAASTFLLIGPLACSAGDAAAITTDAHGNACIAHLLALLLAAAPPSAGL